MAAPLVPSHSSARDLVSGVPGAAERVGLHYAQRTALLAGALLLAGERRRVLRYALVGSAAIEAFVLWWAWKHRDEP